MTKYLRRSKKVDSVVLHPRVKEFGKIIEHLSSVIYPNENLKNLISSTVLVEGVVDKNKCLKIFSPLFELRISERSPVELFNKNTAVQNYKLFTDEDVERHLWGQIFKFISTSNPSPANLVLLQKEMKQQFPKNLCREIFNKNFLSESDFTVLTGVSRDKLSHCKRLLKKKEQEQSGEISLDIFVPYTGEPANE